LKRLLRSSSSKRLRYARSNEGNPKVVNALSPHCDQHGGADTLWEGSFND
jgi:hypothetical protein